MASMPAEHPIRQYLDAVAAGQVPKASDVDDLLAELRDGGDYSTTLDEAAIRRLVTETTTTVLGHARAGNSGSKHVLGSPWSEEPVADFAAIGDGTSFQITMNTGAILTYTFEDKRDVRRSETGIFRQVSPGLALLLLGETDEEGLPTATRTLITAGYPPDQELGRTGE